MADLASSDVTVTVEKTVITGKLRRTRCKIEFGDSALTVGANGVPLPSASSFGMKTRLDYIILTDIDDSNGYIWKYNQDDHALDLYQGDNDNASDGPLVIATTAVAAQTLYCEAVGW